MTKEELTNILLQEHRRDVRLTYLQYGIGTITVLLILGLIVFVFISTGANMGDVVSNFTKELVDGVNNGQYPVYLKFVIPLAVFGIFACFVQGLIKHRKRPKRIEELVQHLEKGSKTVQVTETKVYKLKIPLLVVNLNTGLVTLLTIVLQGSNKAFILPVPASHLEEVKSILAENS